jgi:hypothetical protein
MFILSRGRNSKLISRSDWADVEEGKATVGGDRVVVVKTN